MFRIFLAGIFTIFPLQIFAADGAAVGDLLWEFEAAPASSYNDRFTEPAIGPDGTIYLGYIESNRATSGTFYALKPDGTERWKETFTFTRYSNFDAVTRGFETPTVGDDGTVYFSCSSTQYAYSADGIQKWKRSFPQLDPRDIAVRMGPVAVSQNDRIHLPINNNGFFGLDANDGKTVSHLRPAVGANIGNAQRAVIFPDSSLLLVSPSSYLYRLNAEGEILFRYYSGGKDLRGLPFALSETNRIVSIQGGWDEPYYVTIRSQEEGAFPTFLTDYPGVSVTPVIDHDQSLIFPDRKGHLIKVDRNLNEVWSLNGYADQSPVLCADGTIFAVTNDHENPTIRNLDSEGNVVFEIKGVISNNKSTKPHYSRDYDTVLPLANLTLSHSGILYAASRNGTVYAFKAPAGLSTSNWPKINGGLANASRLDAVAPEVTEQPVGFTVISGKAKTLSVGYTGRPAPSIQWFRDGEAIPQATGANYVVGYFGISGAGEYHAELTNRAGAVQTEKAKVEVVHELTLSTVGGGTISTSPEQDIYEHLSEITATATAAEGFKFKKWTGAVESEQNPVTISLDRSKTLTANFIDIQLPTLSVDGDFPAVTNTPEFLLTGSVSDNTGIATIRTELNGYPPVFISHEEEKFEINLPLQFGMNRLKLTVTDHAGLEVEVTKIITWEPDRFWTVQTQETSSEAEVLAVDIFLTSPGDVAGANISLTTDPTYLSYLRFKPARVLERTFQTLSEVDGEMSLTFASAGRTIPAGKQRLGRVFYRVRSLPEQLEEDLLLQQINLAGGDGSPFDEVSGIQNATITLVPRSFPGDINNNGRYDSGDAQQLQRLLGGLEEKRPWDDALNDVNESGSFEIGDIIVVLQSAAGIRPQPSEPRNKSNRGKVAIPYDPSAPWARVILDPPHAQAGETVKVKIVIDRPIEEFGGTSFKLKYPVEALRLVDFESLQMGELQPPSLLHLWNVGPSRDNFAEQNGILSFAAGSAESWPESENGGVIAELDFVVQGEASSKDVWKLELLSSELSFANGLTVSESNLEPAFFVGNPLTWSAWRQDHFSADELNLPEVSSKNADPDRDGITNEMEFYHGTNPGLSDAADGVNPVWVETGNGEIFFGLEVRHDPRVTDFSPILEWSDDLEQWRSDVPGREGEWWVKTPAGNKESDESTKFLLLDLRDQSPARNFLRSRAQSR